MGNDRRFFPLMGGAFGLVAVVGFWPFLVAPTGSGGAELPIAIVVHAIVMFGWLAVFVIQSLLPGAGKIHLHKLTGYASIALFLALWVSSITISIGSFAGPVPAHIRTLISNLFFLQIVAWFLSPLLYVMAFRARKTSLDDHKRYMLLLTFFLIEAAASRIRWLPGMSSEEYWLIAQYLYLDVFLVALVIYDKITLGHLAKATRVGLVMFATYQLIAVVTWDSAIWLSTADYLLAVFARS